VDEQRLNGPSDSYPKTSEPAKTSGRSTKSSRKSSRADQGKGEPNPPGPKLSEIDFLLSIWQSDCAELRAAGVKVELSAGEGENGEPTISTRFLGVSFCHECGRFHETRTAHICTKS
jgi:hypothetical protein